MSGNKVAHQRRDLRAGARRVGAQDERQHVVQRWPQDLYPVPVAQRGRKQQLQAQLQVSEYIFRSRLAGKCDHW